MKKIPKKPGTVRAEEIARMADRGENVSRFFKGEGKMVQPIRRVNVDATTGLPQELDKAAQDLNVSRQAVIEVVTSIPAASAPSPQPSAGARSASKTPSQR